ncbi:MAG: hypothetical protein HC820_04940 [Hydrococcus sp. RM1_1_31]|nr:hypothetical protein [Hydrococcus sp. RM1_1_31]
MTWTKEQLKTLAGATPSATRSSSTLTQFSEPTLTSEEEEYSLKKRNFTTRAIPKAIFATVVVAPVFAFAYFFMSGNLSRSQKVSAQTKVDEETQQLREQLAATTAQLDEVQAKLAAMRQEKSRQEPVAPKAERTVKKAKTVPPRQPQRVVRVSTPPRPLPPRTISPTPIRRSLPRTPIVRPSSVNKTPQVVEPTVYGAGAIDGELISSNDEMETVGADYSPQNHEGTALSEEVQLENSQHSVESETTTVDSALEAPLVQEQSMVRLNAGTFAKATLAVPFVRDPRSDKQNIFTIHLDEPLIAETGDIVLPAGTTILVKAESLESADVVEFVGVEAYLPSSQKFLFRMVQSVLATQKDYQ